MTTLDLITREDLAAFKTELFAELRKMSIGSSVDHNQKSWLKSVEVRRMLNISPGTLQNMRINGTLPYSKVGSMLYYKIEDIEQLLEGNLSTNP